MRLLGGRDALASRQHASGGPHADAPRTSPRACGRGTCGAISYARAVARALLVRLCSRHAGRFFALLAIAGGAGLPGELSRADRRLLIGAGALAVLMAAVTIAFAPAHGAESTVPSSYDSGSGGARAAYLLLEQLHYLVRRWEDSPLRLREVNPHA